MKNSRALLPKTFPMSPLLFHYRGDAFQLENKGLNALVPLVPPKNNFYEKNPKKRLRWLLPTAPTAFRASWRKRKTGGTRGTSGTDVAQVAR